MMNLTLDAYQKYTVEVYNVILEKTVMKLKIRFTGIKKLFSDLSCLYPSDFVAITNNGLSSAALNCTMRKTYII